MPSKPRTVKVAYDLSVEAKHRLTMPKADLRLAGVPATETGILELLILSAEPKKLATQYRKSQT